MTSLHPKDYFDMSSPTVAHIFAGVEFCWQILPRIGELVAESLKGRRIIKGDVMAGAHIGDGPIYIGEGAIVEPGAYVIGPSYIGPGVVLRQGSYVRANVMLLDGSMLGHAGEAKNALFLPGAKAPHFAYVGDSIMGHRTNLGAGTKLSNTLVTGPHGADRPTIKINFEGDVVDTGLTKFGAILGDDVQIGCNAVLNPGTLIGPRGIVYPNATISKGIYPPDVIVKIRQNQIMSERRENGG
jgi:UDP-N-acetylglucosamine diphosphorylase / glucose-1-phosphate thymidylyltransferase / UDP-N-acetylgalactosamine diphosphorylase / glucosamine-1-phosphate N-acetyltransferase / galactosamine-1-phosphate N-acetyltransferase